jgi:hypothetical protein
MWAASLLNPGPERVLRFQVCVGRQRSRPPAACRPRLRHQCHHLSGVTLGQVFSMLKSSVSKADNDNSPTAFVVDAGLDLAVPSFAVSIGGALARFAR